MEDMKNLIIQSLETKGVLGQIRAKLRSAVFKIVDEQDQQFNMGCGLKWENPTLYKILETKIGTLLAEVIREFMEYFRMDYSLSIFIPECGISPERLKKEEIFGKMGILQNEQNDKFTAGLQLPLIYYIMYYFIEGIKSSPQKVFETIKKAQDDIEKKSDDIIDSNIVDYLRAHHNDDDLPLSNERPENDKEKEEKKEKEEGSREKKEGKKEKKRDSYEADDVVQRKGGLKLELEDEEEAVIKEKPKDQSPAIKEEILKPESILKETNKPETIGNQPTTGEKEKEKPKEEDILEEIAVEDLEDSVGAGKGGSSNNYNGSQTVSASQGYDNTVDSNALENYNYVENVEKK